MKNPLTPTMLLMPSAIPRWWAGNASVMIAAALASRQEPPIPCTIRKTMRDVAPPRPEPEEEEVGRPPRAVEPVDREHERGDGVDDEAEVVDAPPADHVPEPAQ